MGDNGSATGNTAIVAIVVLVFIALGLAYFFGFFGPKDGSGPTKVIETPRIIKEK